MSTVAYGVLTWRRELSSPTKSSFEAAPGVKSYVDALAALVPAEVLSVHALILSFASRTDTNDVGQAVTTITDPVLLRVVFLALCVISVLLYVASHGLKDWDNWDWARMLIPPSAFVGWTMLQKATAFDAVMPDLSDPRRYAIGVLLAVVLGVIAGMLSNRADRKDPDASRSQHRPAGSVTTEVDVKRV